ncbi:MULTISPECIES: hypothetical protein [unclassified Bradyrhizobium]|uniref:hypothetical protein n=1 Tax=unclassified Bradyrhizobium TaxID=2631580 RepID=UPI0024789221|nr:MULTISPECIES: hypothetical protein [unclassified Bradyrhizobium]WGR67848.1 hypothetical protein MTX24_20480 [Bradyrhizobium sp. ISRA426]WGR79901.1 hypothetical protein MTX21_05595 [Bradyrhizobium sp. ISRA430]WGR83087.1 hypothetical protein MTX25_20160 [Bradyrhizobium sp. ISRA432]
MSKRNSRADRKHIKWLEDQLAKERKRKGSRRAAVFFGTIAIVGFVLSFQFLWPRMTLDADPSSFDPRDPHPLQFKLTNTGFISLNDVQIDLGLCFVQTDGPLIRIDPIPCSPTWLRFAQLHVDTRTRDQKYTFRIDDALTAEKPVSLTAADFILKVNYRPGYWPTLWETQFRFFTRPERDGKLSWQSQ